MDVTTMYPYGIAEPGATSTVNVSQRHFRCWPFTVAKDDSYDELMVQISSAVANSTVEVGIYKSQTSGTSEGFPGDKVTSVEISGASAGYATQSVTSFDLEAGKVYWVGYRKGETGGETPVLTAYKWAEPQMQFGMNNGPLNSVLFYALSSSGLLPSTLGSPSQTYLSYAPYLGGKCA